ncbi:protein of unknown function [Methylorubrum extorquens]|uniref:Uncharacterized protein n=1 Tax=Methylorubrum extorquens TaxID=408 RepID=A0A2N9AID1_METEX|nr:protein of unknown function [Methylorubrum extorquens]
MHVGEPETTKPRTGAGLGQGQRVRRGTMIKSRVLPDGSRGDGWHRGKGMLPWRYALVSDHLVPRADRVHRGANLRHVGAARG